MTATYCTAAQVYSFLQLSTAKQSELATEVAAAIERAQDEVDKYTETAFRSISVANEYHSLRTYIGANGIPIKLDHSHVTTLATPTDKLEIYNGSAYVDLLVTGTAGRSRDYWQEEGTGKIWIRSNFSYFGGNEVRVTYRYGHSSVPKDVESATIMLASVGLITSDDRSAMLPEGGGNFSLPFVEKARIWEKRAYKLLDSYTEMSSINR